MHRITERHPGKTSQPDRERSGSSHPDRREESSTTTAREPWRPLVVLCIAQFMVILDATVVNVALPSIGRDLGFATNDLQWVVTAYVLMTGGLMLLGGRMADLFGRRAVFLTGLLVFTAASLASGLAPTSGALIAARAAQGLGAAMLSPGALSIITATYTDAQRTTALSAWGAIGGAGAPAGLLLGGMLTTWLSWEWVFFINVPVGIATAMLARRIVPSTSTGAGSWRELDLPGAAAVVSGLVVLVYAVEGTSSHGWGSARTLGLLGLAGALLTAFAAIERRAHRPLIPTATWRIRSLVSSSTVILGVTGILVGTFFINSLLLQNVLQASALETGLAFLPLCVVVGAAAHVGPRLLRRFGARGLVVVGLALIACGDLLLTGATAHASYASDLLPGFLLVGFGLGLTFVPLSVAAMSEIPSERAGAASGLLTTAHEIGGAFGVAVFSAVAVGSGAAGGALFVGGYGNAALVAAASATAMAVVALIAIPPLRPASLGQVTMHGVAG
jgi:EmrB/QacA subfamily drug resistance transporter